MRNLDPARQEPHAPYYLWDLALTLYRGIYHLEKSQKLEKLKRKIEKRVLGREIEGYRYCEGGNGKVRKRKGKQYRKGREGQ